MSMRRRIIALFVPIFDRGPVVDRGASTLSASTDLGFA
jgi:hypothetical protein